LKPVGLSASETASHKDRKLHDIGLISLLNIIFFR